jgi:hypothetical protein
MPAVDPSGYAALLDLMDEDAPSMRVAELRLEDPLAR